MRVGETGEYLMFTFSQRATFCFFFGVDVPSLLPSAAPLILPPGVPVVLPPEGNTCTNALPATLSFTMKSRNTRRGKLEKAGFSFCELQPLS